MAMRHGKLEVWLAAPNGLRFPELVDSEENKIYIPAEEGQEFKICITSNYRRTISIFVRFSGRAHLSEDIVTLLDENSGIFTYHETTFTFRYPGQGGEMPLQPNAAPTIEIRVYDTKKIQGKTTNSEVTVPPLEAPKFVSAKANSLFVTSTEITKLENNPAYECGTNLLAKFIFWADTSSNLCTKIPLGRCWASYVSRKWPILESRELLQSKSSCGLPTVLVSNMSQLVRENKDDFTNLNRALKCIGYTITQHNEDTLPQALSRSLVGSIKEDIVEFLKSKLEKGAELKTFADMFGVNLYVYQYNSRKENYTTTAKYDFEIFEVVPQEGCRIWPKNLAYSLGYLGGDSWVQMEVCEIVIEDDDIASQEQEKELEALQKELEELEKRRAVLMANRSKRIKTEK